MSIETSWSRDGELGCCRLRITRFGPPGGASGVTACWQGSEVLLLYNELKISTGMPLLTDKRLNRTYVDLLA